jgi:hypothetical protein
MFAYSRPSLVAQNPAEFETLEKLDDSDRNTIRHEYRRRWSHPRALYVTIVLCSIGAATQLVRVLRHPCVNITQLRRGWDQTGSNGASKS